MVIDKEWPKNIDTILVYAKYCQVHGANHSFNYIIFIQLETSKTLFWRR